MPFLRVKISGLDEAYAVLDPQRVDRALQAAMAEIGQRALVVWRAATPRRTGRLRRSEHVGAVGPLHLQFRVRPDGFYYAPQNARRGMTAALGRYLGSDEVQAIFTRHLTAALGGG